jgi:hypothetical protein
VAWNEFTMGIMDSQLVKIGIDILTKLLELINNATDGFGNLAKSIVKIISVIGIFKLGMKIFEKFKQPIFGLFTSIVKEAGTSGL